MCDRSAARSGLWIGTVRAMVLVVGRSRRRQHWAEGRSSQERVERRLFGVRRLNTRRGACEVAPTRSGVTHARGLFREVFREMPRRLAACLYWGRVWNGGTVGSVRSVTRVGKVRSGRLSHRRGLHAWGRRARRAPGLLACGYAPGEAIGEGAKLRGSVGHSNGANFKYTVIITVLVKWGWNVR